MSTAMELQPVRGSACVGSRHAFLIQDQETGGCRSPHDVGLRVGPLDEQFGRDDSRRISHDLDRDGGMFFLERLELPWDLIVFEGGVDEHFLRILHFARFSARPGARNREDTQP